MLEILDKPSPSMCSVLAKLQNRQYFKVFSVVIFFGFFVEAIRQLVDIAFLWSSLKRTGKPLIGKGLNE
jgi:hypothetical protein